jgi:RND family efflux transporter MFP subunit
VITERNIHTGHFLQSNTEGSTNKGARPLFDMVRMDLMRITIQVPEADAVLIKNDAPCTVSIQGLLDREISAKVTRCSWSLDDHARTLWVEIHVPNPKEELRPGMYAYASIEAEVPNALVVPATALMDDGDAHYLCVVNNGKIERTAVKLGYRTDDVVQVLQKKVILPKSHRAKWVDLTGTEMIVARDVGALLDGQEVTAEAEHHDSHASLQSSDTPPAHAGARPATKFVPGRAGSLAVAPITAQLHPLPLGSTRVSVDSRPVGQLDRAAWSRHLVAEN